MKKYIILSLLALAAWSCGDDDNGIDVGNGGYSTDGLTLKAEMKALLLTGYNRNIPSMYIYEVARKQLESEYGNRLNHVSLATQTNDLFYNADADSIRFNFFSLTPPYFVLDGEEQTPSQDLLDGMEDALMKKPILDVNHKVQQNDTAWIIDNKIKFFKDTVSDGLLIETYLLARVKASMNNKVDLTMPEVNNYIETEDSTSTWQQDIFNLDSSKVVIKEGEAYYHDYIMLDSYNPNNAYGTQVGSYWPFGPQFFKNDVIGTEDTPMRHYFLKPEKGDFDFEFQPRFLTVVWIKDPFTNSWTYVNSVQTNKL